MNTTDKKIEHAKDKLARFGCLIIAGAVLLALGLVQFYIDILEQICPACFGR